jgi:hypothetical protein
MISAQSVWMSGFPCAWGTPSETLAASCDLFSSLALGKLRRMAFRKEILFCGDFRSTGPDEVDLDGEDVGERS